MTITSTAHTTTGAIDAEVVDETAITTTEPSGYLTYGSSGSDDLNLVRIGAPKSVEADHPEVSDCLFWRYPHGDQPLYMPFRQRNGKPQNAFYDLQLVAIEDSLVRYQDSPDAAKLNLTVTNDLDSTSNDLTFTAGLGSAFGISVLQGLTAMLRDHGSLTPFKLSATAKRYPNGTCHFAYISVDGEWQKHDDLFVEFQELKAAAREVGAPAHQYPPLLSKCRELVALISQELPK